MTTAEDQSKQARSRLPHQVNNQYRGGILKRRCCVQGYHVYKDMWEAAVGEVLICEREPDNASNRYAVDAKRRNYCWTFASRTNKCVRCRKCFTGLIICCTKYFAIFIFVALSDYENILTMKISRFMEYWCNCINTVWQYCTYAVLSIIPIVFTWNQNTSEATHITMLNMEKDFSTSCTQLLG